MKTTHSLPLVLSRELDRIRSKNPQFSLRAFARQLAMPPSALSEVMNGKRNVSLKAVERIASRLMLAPDLTQKLLHENRSRHGSRQASRQDSQQGSHERLLRPQIQIAVDHYRLISDWFHFAILSLAETIGFQSDPEWIARRLGLTKKTATLATERLHRFGLLDRDEDGRLSVTGKSFTTPDGIQDLSLRRAHAGNLDLARTSLERDPIDARDFTSMTMAIDPAKIPEAKKRIRAFQRELSAFLEADRKTEVYKICVQFIPLSQPTDQQGNKRK